MQNEVSPGEYMTAVLNLLISTVEENDAIAKKMLSDVVKAHVELSEADMRPKQKFAAMIEFAKDLVVVAKAFESINLAGQKAMKEAFEHFEAKEPPRY